MECLEVIDSFWMDGEVREEFQQLTAEENYFLYQEVEQGNRLRSISGLPVNKCKNRYSTYRPLNETRVILETLEGSEGSDYINASFISGDSDPYEYIACQAPLDSTTEDFWRMVWEQRCGVIVMVTDLEAKKASQYWPEEAEILRFGQLLVCNKKKIEMGDIDVRSLLLKESGVAGGGETREIIHLQYRHWPDFGVPASTKPIRDLLSLSNKFKERATTVYSLEGPMIVHCSAGVGRTGAFIAVDIGLKCLRKGEEPNIKQIVRRLRSQRQGMVRTQEQYMLIHVMILEVLGSKRSPRTSGKSLRSSSDSLRSSSDSLRSSTDSLRISNEPFPMEVSVMD